MRLDPVNILLGVNPSSRAQSAFRAEARPSGQAQPTPGPERARPADPSAQTNTDGDTFSRASGAEDLSPEEQQKVDKLKARDTEVRRHEEAHKAAAGSLFRGGPNYTFQTGPDGNRYAVGGNVQIDTSPGRTPEETISKAARIRAAALAPADPSSTDQRVAASASRMEAEARAELATEQPDDAAPGSEPTASTEPTTTTPDPRGGLEKLADTPAPIDIYA